MPILLIPEIMARAGFDRLAVVDLEHSVVTIRETGELIRVIDLCGVVPFVRLSANDPVQIKRGMGVGVTDLEIKMAVLQFIGVNARLWSASKRDDWVLVGRNMATSQIIGYVNIISVLLYIMRHYAPTQVKHYFRLFSV